MVKKLCSSQDICDAIEKRQMLANLNNARITSLQKTSTRIELVQVNTRAFVIPVYENTSVIHHHLIVDNLTRFYNFYSNCNDSVLKSHFMSDQTDFEINRYMTKVQLIK